MTAADSVSLGELRARQLLPGVAGALQTDAPCFTNF